MTFTFQRLFFVIAYRLCKQGTAIQTSHHDGKVKIPKNYVANPRTEETPSGKKCTRLNNGHKTSNKNQGICDMLKNTSGLEDYF